MRTLSRRRPRLWRYALQFVTFSKQEAVCAPQLALRQMLQFASTASVIPTMMVMAQRKLVADAKAPMRIRALAQYVCNLHGLPCYATTWVGACVVVQSVHKLCTNGCKLAVCVGHCFRLLPLSIIFVHFRKQRRHAIITAHTAATSRPISTIAMSGLFFIAAPYTHTVRIALMFCCQSTLMRICRTIRIRAPAPSRCVLA